MYVVVVGVSCGSVGGSPIFCRVAVRSASRLTFIEPLASCRFFLLLSLLFLVVDRDQADFGSSYCPIHNCMCSAPQNKNEKQYRGIYIYIFFLYIYIYIYIYLYTHMCGMFGSNQAVSPNGCSGSIATSLDVMANKNNRTF